MSSSPLALPRRRGEKGYALVLALALIALVTLGADQLALRVDHWRQQTALLTDYADGLAAAYSARARTLVWLASHPANPMGYGPVTVDERPFRTTQGAVVAVQDERGLLSLHAPETDALARLLAGSGSAAANADRLIDTLADYTDTDSLHRLHGAEAEDYARAGLPPPRNDLLSSPRELRNMPGWRDDPAARAYAERFTSARRDLWFNPWSAPVEVLRARWPAVPASGIDLFLQMRMHFSAFPDFNAMAAGLATIPGVPADFHLAPVPGDQLRVRITPRAGPAHVYVIMLTPLDMTRPWLIADAHIAARSAENHAMMPPAGHVASPFPDFSGRPSDP